MNEPSASTTSERHRREIPISLAPCFQEYSLADLDPERDQDLIIERTLARGNRAEVRWLLGCYGRGPVNEWLERMGARRLPRGRLRLWSVLLLQRDRAPKRELDAVWPH